MKTTDKALYVESSIFKLHADWLKPIKRNLQSREDMLNQDLNKSMGYHVIQAANRLFTSFMKCLSFLRPVISYYVYVSTRVKICV